MLTEKFFISSEQLEEFYEIFRKDVTYVILKVTKIRVSPSLLHF